MKRNQRFASSAWIVFRRSGLRGILSSIRKHSIIQAFFGNIIGISDPEKEPENIELWFEAEQSKYILSQPIHASQRVLEQTDAGCRIGLKVVINYELLMLLLSYGSHVKVLSPAHLARQIQQEARKMVALYDNK